MVKMVLLQQSQVAGHRSKYASEYGLPAVADMDGDGTLDILIGDTLVSQQISDFAPLSDGGN